MKKTIIISAVLLALGSTAALAQGIVGGIREGSEDGARAAGPVGGFVGGVVGGVAGGVAGLLGVDQRPRFREYVVSQKPQSYRYNGDVVVGVELPSSGVTYYEAPAEYGIRDHRYTVVNDRTVLVDPRTHRVIQVIE
jgi:hypothetical protein